MQLNGIAINKKYCKEQVSSHPDYPALISVIDLLEDGSLEYTAAQADFSYIHEFNYPVLAHIKQPGNEFLHIVESDKAWEIKKEITQHWSGVVLFADKNSSWQNAQNELYHKKERSNKLYIAVVFSTLVALYGITVWMNPLWYAAVFGIFSIVGLFTSILIIGSELGVQNSITKQVCGAISAGGCDAVLKTNYSKGIFGFSTGDISALYFATQFVAFLFSSIYPNLFLTSILISLLGIFVAIWSVYTQAIIIRQWCALCLVIVAVLFVQFIMSATLLFFSPLFILSFPIILVLLSVGIIGAIILFPIKDLLKKVSRFDQISKELKKWKLDANLFIAQWEKEEFVDTTIWENDLIIGNPQAPLKITEACNPYCGPCANAHKVLDEMLDRYRNIVCIQLRFICQANNNEDVRTMVVENILRKSLEFSDYHQLQKMMSDWFSDMNYENWLTRWKATNNFSVNEKLNHHEKWIERSQISFTPTFFVNGKKLLVRYEISEFGNLLPRLSERLATITC